MDGSIATSASLRMRDQLRGALHAPAGGADAGLFEELLRMPALEARPEPKADASATESDALAEAAAAKANQKPATKPAREKEEDDADEDSVEEASAENVDRSVLVQPIPTQPTAVEAPTQRTEKVAPPPQEAAAQTQPIASKDASTNRQPQDGNKDAVIERPAEPVAASQPPPTTADGSQQPQVVEAAAETPTTPAAEANVSVEPSQVPAAAPAPAPTGGDAAPSDQTPHRSTDVRPSTEVQSEPQGIPAPATVQAQPQPESQTQLKPQAQPPTQASVQPQAQTGVPQSQQTSDEREVRADNSGERREKWFLRDDDRVRTEDAEAAAPNAREDHAPVEAPPPIPSAADPVNALSSSDALAAPGDAAAADVLQPPPALDAAAIASTLAQQSVGGNVGAARSDSRSSSQGVGQVTGGQTASASASQAAGAGRAERDKGGVAGLSQQERVRLVQRVARSFSRLGPDGGQVTLKLHPPQLGVLNMSVRIEGQSMTARLHTETASARDAILENLPVLRERLAEQGIEVESFQVEVTSDRNLAADNQSQSQSQNPFSGDPSSDSRGGARSVDYRRLSRGNGSPQPFGAPTRATDSQRWSSHLPLGRTLDVRA